MKVQALAGVLFAGAMALSTPAFAQASATAPATGSTTIIRPVTITNTAGLAFGRIVKPTAATGTGTVTISNSSDAVTTSPGTAALAGITTSRAKFDILGEGNTAITITVPDTFDLTLGANTIEVTLDPDKEGTQTLVGAVGSDGTLALNVGGSFSVSDTMPTGAYSGSFNVTVAYN